MLPIISKLGGPCVGHIFVCQKPSSIEIVLYGSKWLKYSTSEVACDRTNGNDISAESVPALTTTCTVAFYI